MAGNTAHDLIIHIFYITNSHSHSQRHTPGKSFESFSSQFQQLSCLELPSCWWYWYWPWIVPGTLFRYALDGWAQLSTWQKMKSLIVIWTPVITHLTQSKCFGRAVKQVEKSYTYSWVEREPDEPLLVWLVEPVEMKLTTIGRPGRMATLHL